MLPAKRGKVGENQNAVPFNRELKPPILSILASNGFCLDEQFDYLPLESLCAVGRTCKQLQHAAGIYFYQNFPMEEIVIGRDSKYSPIEQHIQQHPSILTNLAPYSRRIAIKCCDSGIFRHAATIKYRFTKDLGFYHSNDFNEDYYSCIMKMNADSGILKNILTLRFLECSDKFTGPFLNRILPLCTSLEYLILECDIPNGEWMHRRIPTLVGLKVDDYQRTDEIKSFLQANPQIKNISAEKDDILKMVQDIGLKLDDFELPYDCFSWRRLNALKRKGHLGRVQAMIRHTEYDDDVIDEFIKDMSKVTCLTSLQIWEYSYDFPDLSPLENLQKLSIEIGDMSSEQAEILSKSLNNLEEIYLETLSDVMPFVRRLPKLRIIEASDIENINLKVMNDDRKKLPNAETLKIFLRDEAYQQVRWRWTDLFLEMVEIRRAILTNLRWF